MSLWCDKHRPKTLASLDYHKEQAEQLKKLVSQYQFKSINLYFNKFKLNKGALR